MKRFFQVIRNNAFDLSSFFLILGVLAFYIWWVSGLGASS